MPMMPKRVKYRKSQKGRVKGNATRGNYVAFGEYGLQTLEAGAHRIPMHVSPAVAPLAQVNPLAFSGRGVAKMFSTHPPTAERVARLAEVARAA